jgi:transcriptional regulator of acetoin/glycerol metabolism
MKLSTAAEQALGARAWPGNVRQLRNVLERAALLSDHANLEPDDMGEGPGATPPSATPGARMTLAEAERLHIEAVLREERGAVARAAEVLGISRSSLYERIKKHGIVVGKRADS